MLKKTPYCQVMLPKTPHQAIQKAIKATLPQVILEKSFPEIHRIADVVYPPKKIIYEIQYSPISLKEVQKRNRDYAALGYTVIWILHDHHYNKKILSPAELYLRKNLSYYTSITPYGHGFFYDQLEFFRGNQRTYKGTPQIIKNLLPQNLSKLPRNFPKTLKEKAKKNSICLSGDLIDTLINTKDFKQVKELENCFYPHRSFKAHFIKIFEYLLKKNAAPKDLSR
ncbi:MAG: hypothetical protein H7A41_02425 [Chlamydiales bacterium]|nr:hypothetical protein [Chlamydiales bacterium]